MRKILTSSFILTFMFILISFAPLSARSIDAGDYYANSNRYNSDMYTIDFAKIKERFDKIDFNKAIDISTYDGVIDYDYVSEDTVNNFKSFYDDMKVKYNESNFNQNVSDSIDKLVEFFDVSNFPGYN